MVFDSNSIIKNGVNELLLHAARHLDDIIIKDPISFILTFSTVKYDNILT